jgi:hypothetical protein
VWKLGNIFHTSRDSLNTLLVLNKIWCWPGTLWYLLLWCLQSDILEYFAWMEHLSTQLVFDSAQWYLWTPIFVLFLPKENYLVRVLGSSVDLDTRTVFSLNTSSEPLFHQILPWNSSSGSFSLWYLSLGFFSLKYPSLRPLSVHSCNFLRFLWCCFGHFVGCS